jgi:hypothetical protein
VLIEENVVLGKCGEYMIKCKLSEEISIDEDVMFSADRYRLSKKHVAAADALYRGNQLNNRNIMIRVINPMTEHNILYKGTKLGQMKRIPQDQCVNMFDNNDGITSNQVIREILKAHENEIGKEEYKDLENILHRYKRIFSCSSTDVGRITIQKHQIETGDHQPIALNPRRVPKHLEDKVDDLVKDLEEKRIITPVVSPWNFPIVVVPKKNGNIRMCIDYRKLNAITKRPIYYIP